MARRDDLCMAGKSRPEITVHIRNAHHLHSLSRTLKDLRPILDLSEPTVVNLDLSALTFIGPACLALMVAAVRRGRETDMIFSGKITYPNSVAARTYLHRMDVFRVLFEKEPVEVEDEVERHEAGGLKECEHFASAEGGRRVAKGLAKAIQEKVETDAVTANSLDVCLIELTENVYFHAGTPNGGFAAAQTFKNSQEIEIAIVDLGVGVAKSLSANPEHAEDAADDISAIKAAIQPLVTATPERNSGYGLALTRLLLELNDGRLIVWSGEGKVQLGEKSYEKRVDNFPGTMVALRLHTDRPFDIATAYERLNHAIEEIEGPPNDDVRTLRQNATS
jgi:anti-sigma regulatory factor (Ser/Thr protein kinase)/anti-anti-sigma regulatory factor